jgi:enoyl-CoA hydratase/carnithine racemase
VSLIEQHVDSRVAVITLNDAEHGNRLHPESLGELAAAFDRSLRDPEVRAVLLRSNGPVFCLGMDLGESAAHAGQEFQAEAQKAIGVYADLLAAIFSASLPVVCFVQGEVKAGGVGLACVCDIVLAGEQAAFEMGEVLFGLIPANVLPYLLALRLPAQKARYLVLSSQRISAAEALRLNLVDELVPSMEAAERRLHEIFKRLLRSSPLALSRAKAFTGELIGRSPAEGGALARRRLLEILRDPATMEGVQAFQEGGVPSWFSRFKPERTLVLPDQTEVKEQKR